jgi:hypothetical protein
MHDCHDRRHDRPRNDDAQDDLDCYAIFQVPGGEPLPIDVKLTGRRGNHDTFALKVAEHTRQAPAERFGRERALRTIRLGLQELVDDLLALSRYGDKGNIYCRHDILSLPPNT